MTMRPSGLIIDLRHGAFEGRQIKQWIISEAKAAPRVGEDAPFKPCPQRSEERLHPGRGQHALVSGAAILIGNPGELL